MTGDEMRQEIFDDSAQRLADMAHRAVHVLGHAPADIVTVAIHVDDPDWTDLAETLMPGADWQSYRDRGEKPIARGTAMAGVANYIAHVCPTLAESIHTGPPDGHLFAFVMDGGGASVYAVPYGG
jgi:hypothetical protein